MRLAVRHYLGPLALVGCLAGGGPLRADPPAVQDNAGLFRPETRRRAEEEIPDLWRRYGLEVRVETAATYPANRARPQSNSRDHPPATFFTEWAQERARAAGDRGVFLFICKEPLRVRVVVGPDVPEDLFSDRDGSQLQKSLEKSLDRKAKNYDAALLAALRQIESLVNTNITGRFNWPVTLTIIGAILVAWLVLGVVRAMLGLGTVAEAGGPPGLTAGLLGGMFGSTAGLWLYRRLGRRPGPPREAEVHPDLTADGENAAAEGDGPREDLSPDEAVPPTA
jgi:hypothetical protein